MISKQRIVLLWLIMQVGNLISFIFGVELETVIANAFFSCMFMLLLIIAPTDKDNQ